MSVFRIATKQAIREIIEENASSNRFGFSLTDDNVECITDRVVDLFEMTLTLRSRVAAPLQAESAEPVHQTQRRTPTLPSQERVGFPKTINAAEIYDGALTPRRGLPESQVPPQQDFKLPRKRTVLSDEEKERLIK